MRNKKEKKRKVHGQPLSFCVKVSPCELFLLEQNHMQVHAILGVEVRKKSSEWQELAVAHDSHARVGGIQELLGY
jgi:hypothetical protein